jgi:hypothetical protein
MATTHSWYDRSHKLTDEMSRDLHDLATIRRVAPARQAFVMLWALFALLPVVVGIDKFLDGLVNWQFYLADWVNDLLPGTAHQAMLVFGVVEILAGILVLLAPRYGAYVVALWLAAIIVNLVTQDGYYDVAVRDFGLMVGALALGRLAASFRTPLEPEPGRMPMAHD